MYNMKTTTIYSILLLLFVTSATFGQRDFYVKKKDGTVARSSAEKRVALVIGNNAYQHTTPLKNPTNDASDMKNMLTELGFEVVYLQDGNRQQMISKIREFRALIEGQRTVALFFYAGHGLQLKDDNWLVPIDANPELASDVEVTCVSLNYLMSNLEQANSGVNLVILDACRNNPFKYAGRSGGGGLTAPNATPSGSFIAFSTSPGNVASDGTGRNSPYTAALLKVLPQPNITIEKAFKNARTMLQQSTGQIPWENSSLLGDFYFNPTGGSDVIIDNNKDVDTDEEVDDEVENINTKDILARQMVFVKGGTFEMGDARGSKDAQPVHKVKLKDFQMSKFEITQAQWRAIMRYNPSKFIGCDECPVENVSWSDVQTFIQKLNEQTGENYRLPTEAEWEYAARGGARNKAYKYAGSDNVDEVAWYSSTVTNGQVQPVGSKTPNSLGLYDMSGNVYEWCADWYGKKYYGASPNENPTGPESGRYHVIRGGSFTNPASRCEITYRNFIIVSKHKGIGFRLVKDAE